MASEVSELERLAGIVMAVERVSFAQAILRVAEQYPLLRAEAMSTIKQRGPSIPNCGEAPHRDE